MRTTCDNTQYCRINRTKLVEMGIGKKCPVCDKLYEYPKEETPLDKFEKELDDILKNLSNWKWGSLNIIEDITYFKKKAEEFSKVPINHGFKEKEIWILASLRK